MFSKILILVAVISAVSGYVVYMYTDSLSNYYGRFKEAIVLPKSGGLLKFQDIDFDCVDEKIKISENGDKVVKVELASAVFSIASKTCAKSAMEKKFNEILKELKSRINEISGIDKCFKFELAKIDPNSYLLENKEVIISQEEIEECNDLNLNKVLDEVLAQTFSREFDDEIQKCDNRSIDKKNVISFYVLAENDESAQFEKKQKLFKEIELNYEEALSCLMKPIDDMEAPMSTGTITALIFLAIIGFAAGLVFIIVKCSTVKKDTPLL